MFYFFYLFLKQDRQCTCNVTMRSVRETTVAVENNNIFLCEGIYVHACVHAHVCVCGWEWVHKRGRVLACV
jgi:hypothetical protein